MSPDNQQNHMAEILEDRMLLSSHAEAFLLRNFNHSKRPLSLIPSHIHISQEQLNDSLVAATKATWLLTLSLIKALCPLMAANRV